MKKAYLYKLLLVILLTGLLHNSFGQEVQSKQFNRTYPMTDRGQLVVENKYGDVELIGWEEDSVKVEIQIDVSGDEDDMIDRIKPTFDYAEEFLKVTTEVAAKSQSYFSRLIRDINPIDLDRNEVEIGIKIFVPIGARMKLKNKFGDIIISDCTGPLQVDIAHGDIRISGTVGKVDAKIEFGLLRAYELSTAEIEIRDGTVDVQHAEHIQLLSRGSEIEVDSVNYMRIESAKDKITIQSIETIRGSLRFSDVQIQSVQVLCDLLLHQSDLSVKSLRDDRTSIFLDQVSSDIEIGADNQSITIDAHLEGGLLRLPKQVKNLDVNVINEKEEIRDIKGQLGVAPHATIQIKGKKGTILIFQKNS